MGRPRRPFNGLEDIKETGAAWMGDELSVPLGVRQRQRWDSSRHWTYRQANGIYDPLTYLFVLDAVAHIDPNIELRAAKLAAYLNLTRQQYFWDPITVGKVLSDLHDSFEDVLGAKMGLLERGKDYRGFFYLLHRNPATADLFAKVREDLMRLAQVEMDARNVGRPSKTLDSPLLEVPSLRGEFDG